MQQLFDSTERVPRAQQDSKSTVSPAAADAFHACEVPGGEWASKHTAVDAGSEAAGGGTEVNDNRGTSAVHNKSSLEPSRSESCGIRVHQTHQAKQMPKERRRSREGGQSGSAKDRRASRKSTEICNGITMINNEAVSLVSEVKVKSNEELGDTLYHVPQVTITPEESGCPREMQEEDWNDRTDSLRRKLSNSSISSAGSSTVLDESEDDILSDNEKKSKGIVTLEPAQETGAGPARPWWKLKTVVHWPFVNAQRKRLSWVQLAGHKGSFKAGDEGTILKKLSENERLCFERLNGDSLQPFVPGFHGVVEQDGESFLLLTDLLANFDEPSVMDCKMGMRTYLEEELVRARERPKLRKDMYDKMLELDSEAPTPEEHNQKAVTKPRYMQWRESLSSTHTLGFRIEGVKRPDGTCNTDFKKTRLKEEVIQVFIDFVGGNRKIVRTYLRRLEELQKALESSEFFKRHEVIGSSLLFIHDHTEKAEMWLIDFGKTTALPEGHTLNHVVPWQEGNREDGFLWGLENMYQLLSFLAHK
ncbi:hypothetical protein GJAV_G00021720 [Gymnothorax javanicus]|nr:hypothetical protein GJAV_G00021720 [Gymnothorax javanicus]